MKTTTDTYSGKQFRYNEIVSYLDTTSGPHHGPDFHDLAPGRIQPKLWAQLNPGKEQPK